MPLINQVHVDKVLSEISVQFKNSSYLADELFPKVPVKKTSDIYFVFDRNFKLPDTLRAIGGLARQADFSLSTAGYKLHKHALKDSISKEEEDNYDLATLKVDCTEFLTDKIKLAKEVEAVQLLDATGTWSLQMSLASAFTVNTTTSNPIAVFDTATAVLLSYGGNKPNFAVMPHKAYHGAKNHTQILERIKYTSSEFTVEMLQGLLDVEKIHVPTGVYDTAQEGVAESMSFLWDKFLFIGYKAPRPAPKSISFAYCFEKAVPAVRTWVDAEREDATIIEVNSQFQLKVVASLCGYLVKGVNA